MNSLALIRIVLLRMTEPASRETEPAETLEQEVAQAIEACDGDILAALRAALVANSFLLGEIEQLMRAVSRGFTRGQSPSRKASEMQDRWREISAGQLPEVESRICIRGADQR
jgi:hypothetical protein